MNKNLKELTDDQLLAELRKTEIDISISHNIQHAKKIQMNSIYGASGNEYFRYFDVRLAEAVTKTGQLVIRWAEKNINEYLNMHFDTIGIDYVIAIDTDSLYISLDKLIEKHTITTTTKDCINLMNDFCENHITKILEDCYKRLFGYTNGIVPRMVMKRETLCSSAVWTAKKHYALDVHDSEGVRYGTPKAKIMGFDMVKSSLPKICRGKMVEACKIILRKNETEFIKFIDQFRKDFKKLSPEEIAFPRSVNNLVKYGNPVSLYSKGCPIHVRAALVYNNAIQQENLTKKYETIKEGEKIKYLYLKLPNRVGENVVGFLHMLPRELKLHEDIDYKMQFQKTFLLPLKTISDVVGWETEKKINIRNFLK